jgi:hypothetical protein
MVKRNVGTIGHKRQVIPVRRKKPSRLAKGFKGDAGRPITVIRKRGRKR